MKLGNLRLAKLFSEGDLSEQQIYQILEIALEKGADFSEIFGESHFAENWQLEDGVVKCGNFAADEGISVRVVKDDKVGLGYTNDFSCPSLIKAAKVAREIVESYRCVTVQTFLPSKTPRQNLYPTLNPLTEVSDQEKIAWLNEILPLAQQLDSRVIEVRALLAAEIQEIVVANSLGIFEEDCRPEVKITVTVMVEANGRREEYCHTLGARQGYREFVKASKITECVKAAVRGAVIKLAAVPAPAGVLPVVLGSGWPAVMLHEAVGHGLEADFNRKGHSAYAGSMGELVASPLVTLIDQGNLPGERCGSSVIDDEGTATQRTVLIENGRLCSYLYDQLNAKLMNMHSTGNGRRASYAYLPLPRMTNTFMLAGKTPPLEQIRALKKGIYAVNFSGGEVEISSGEFVFTTSEAYLIEDGKVTAPLKEVTLMGNGPEVLHKIIAVGDDLVLDSGAGVCGKNGQSVAVGVGEPTLTVSELVIGGSELS